MLVKLLNFRGDGYVAVNPEHVVAIEEVSGGAIFTMTSLTHSTEGNRKEIVNKKVFSCESIDEVLEKFPEVEGETTLKKAGSKARPQKPARNSTFDDDDIPF